MRTIALLCLLTTLSCKKPPKTDNPPLKYRLTLTSADGQTLVGTPTSLTLTISGEEAAATKATYQLEAWHVWERYAGALQDKGQLDVPSQTLACGTHTLTYTPTQPGTHTLKLLIGTQDALQVVECTLEVKRQPGQWAVTLSADQQDAPKETPVILTLRICAEDSAAAQYTIQHWEVHELDTGDEVASVRGNLCTANDPDAALLLPHVLSGEEEQLYFFPLDRGQDGQRIRMTLVSDAGDEKTVSANFSF